MTKSIKILLIILFTVMTSMLMGVGSGVGDSYDDGYFIPLLCAFLASICEICSVLISIILPIIYECRYCQRDRNCIGYIVFSSVLNIPTLTLWVLALFGIFAEPTSNFWSSFAGELHDLFDVQVIIFLSVSSVITISVLIFFCRLNKKLKNPDYVY